MGLFQGFFLLCRSGHVKFLHCENDYFECSCVGHLCSLFSHDLRVQRRSPLGGGDD